VKVEGLEGALKCYEDALYLDSEELSSHENFKAILIRLGKGQPECYEEKLQAAKAAHEKVICNGKSGSALQ